MIFTVDTNESISYIKIYDTANSISEVTLDKNNQYIAETSKAGDYSFQLKVWVNGQDKEIESELVKVTIERFSDTDTTTEHKHDWDIENMTVGKEPTLEEDGYIKIPCKLNDCHEYLKLNASLRVLDKDSYSFNFNNQKDITFNTGNKGSLIAVGVGETELEKDKDYTVNEDGQTVTIYKDVFQQLTYGNYEVAFVYMNIDYDEIKNIYTEDIDIDNINDNEILEKIINYMTVVVATTDIEIYEDRVTDEAPTVDVEEESKVSENPPITAPVDNEKVKKTVQTDDNSSIVFYSVLAVAMGVVFITLKNKKIA